MSVDKELLAEKYMYCSCETQEVFAWTTYDVAPVQAEHIGPRACRCSLDGASAVPECHSTRH